MGRRGRATVVVLGDFGRSPRMQYHALSLSSQAGMDVDVIAFAGAQPHRAVLEDPKISLYLMSVPSFQRLPRLFYLLALPFKILLQLLHLLWLLLVKVPSSDVVLVQNPPSVPVLAVVKWTCVIRKSAFVIDWHNFGYTLFGLRLNPSHILVKLYFWFEKRYGKMADGHLCVTKAMQHELAENWGIRATVVYDRSPEFFQPATLEGKHELFLRLDGLFRQPLGEWDCCSVRLEEDENVRLASRQYAAGRRDSSNVASSSWTLFTCRKFAVEDPRKEIQEGDQYFYLKERPALIVSSTSWTPDEDFEILLEAAVMYDRRVAASLGEHIDSASGDRRPMKNARCVFPRLLIVVTGKGPLRQEYEERISRLRLHHVAFRTMWLAAEDYPRLLGSADLGVSLHTSSSGLDLPMKVVDMFGCGLPVTAVSYSCIDELVKDHQNGLLFSSASELADQFMDLFQGFPDNCEHLKHLRDGALASGSCARWDDEWEKQVLPLISRY
ncbi:UDP-glycosyltransferase TURAN-like [Selaginella moellendorffii]|uniref:UDP-glycosyltransferase TURAN-like n=1 Tax=Selaginella moellendorffii TaxID=88036 RepID=UPI000D1C882A|nr:UDP-glycosyltransferase TURAN-like [Selaginella moellendorffii]|eukprot:XP_024537883.1 UDP-glycosyltransferase TURAN-like [Selaginella moellendorffii]